MKRQIPIGTKVHVKDSVEQWAGHYGLVTGFDGENYTVEGGSISVAPGSGTAPVFSRDELVVRRVKNPTPALTEAIADCEKRIAHWTNIAKNGETDLIRHNARAFLKDAKRGLRNLKKYA